MGVRDPVGARALVLGAPGCQVAIVSAELLVVPEELEAAVRARVTDLALDGLVVGATHTHAGPGGYWENLLGERIGAAPYEPRMREAIVSGIAEAIRRAAAGVAPAEVAIARGTAGELVRNRSGGTKDARLVAVRLARPGGEPVAELAILAAHPTTLGKRNRLISGDWPGRFLRSAGSGAGARLFFQGALGDQSVALPGGGAITPERYGDAVSQAVNALRFERLAAPALGFASGEVVLPAPAPGALPALLRAAARNVVYGALPDHARVATLRLGPAVLVFVPGEPVADVGEAWRAEAGAGAEIVVARRRLRRLRRDARPDRGQARRGGPHVLRAGARGAPRPRGRGHGDGSPGRPGGARRGSRRRSGRRSGGRGRGARGNALTTCGTTRAAAGPGTRDPSGGSGAPRRAARARR